MKHIVAKAVEDIINQNLIEPLELGSIASIKAGERVLILGKRVYADRAALMAVKLDADNPVPLLWDEQHFEYETKQSWQAYSSPKSKSDGGLFTAPEIMADILFRPFEQEDLGISDEEFKQLQAMIRGRITDLLQHTTGLEYTFVLYESYTLRRFPDPLMSIKLKKYQSLNRFDEHATNYVLDCRVIGNVAALREALMNIFVCDANDPFKGLTKHSEQIMKHEGKVVISPQVYFYFTHAEDFLREEQDWPSAVDGILDSILRHAEEWPGDLKFYREEIKEGVKFVFYYHDAENEMIRHINGYLQKKGLRMLDQLP